MASAGKMAGLLVACVLLLFAPLVASQGSCLTQLVPCATYLSGSTPPGPDCCTPLANVVRTNVTCLCELAQLAGTGTVNVSRALELPVQCNIPGVDASTCGITFAPPPSSVTLAPPPQSGGPKNAAHSDLMAPLVSTLVLALASALSL